MKQPRRLFGGLWVLVALSLAVLAIVSGSLVRHADSNGPQASRVLAVVTGSPVRHADGNGPLASRDDPGFEMMAIDPVASHASSWTYGMRLCFASGSDPPVIDSVEPTVSVGNGYRFLGAVIRQFLPTADHQGIISVDNYPPPMRMIPDQLHDVHGFAVTTRCSMDPGADYTELLIGLGIVSDAGGGWKGVDIGYTVGGRHRVLAIDHRLLICGTAVAAECGVPSPSPST